VIKMSICDVMLFERYAGNGPREAETWRMYCETGRFKDISGQYFRAPSILRKRPPV
jgi:hypothetical protein